MEKVFGQALQDYYFDSSPAPLYLHNNYGSTEEMPVEVFFREPEDFPELESLALSLCRGRTLDVGAGAGSHALYLQELASLQDPGSLQPKESKLEIHTIEQCHAACKIMRIRGVKYIVEADFFDYTGDGEGYDTLLFMMNGIGLAGTLENLVQLLEHSKTLLRPGGQLLFDSSDLGYLYEDGTIPRPAGYYGEVGFQYEYKGLKGKPFGWVYVDPETMSAIARAGGWHMEVLFNDGNDQYLARLVPEHRT